MNNDELKKELTAFEMSDSILQKKFVMNRDGGIRSADELCDVFIDDVCSLLEIERPPEDEFCDHNVGDCSEYNAECDIWLSCKKTNREFASDLAQEYEEKLYSHPEPTYHVLWNDGFVIYQNLTVAEQVFLNEGMF